MDLNPLLPFAFSSSQQDQLLLSTEPREKHIIDENALSMYHTRSAQKIHRTAAPFMAKPSMKRKVGESFNEKDDVKRRDFDFFNAPGTSFHDPARSPGSQQHTHDRDPGSGPAIPSSPVIPAMSDYDVDDTADTIPPSPKPRLHELTTSPVKPAYRTHSSEADFGIDRFNRFKMPRITTDLSDLPSELTDDALLFAIARQIIIDAFENVTPAVNLEGMGLTDIPDEIKDLDNLVIFDLERLTQALHQLYLSNNRLRSLNPSLFEFTKLNVLSIRQNCISVLPPAIRNLKNLTDLNISSNRLKFLCPQILELKNLTSFRAGPNPYLAVPEDAIAIDFMPSEFTLRYVTRVKFLQTRQAVPTLRTLALDRIGRYDVTYGETKLWKKHTPKLLHPLIAKAILHGRWQYTCNECDSIVVQPMAEVNEWWDILLNVNIPIKREFCSGACVEKYEARHIFEEKST